ncbi:uncharacterized protein LOC111124846 [Crassostrea virginica]
MTHPFPNEVLEKLFVYMNAENLMRAKKVCNRWNGVIQTLEQKGSVWLDFCIQEIPVYILFDITKLNELLYAKKGSIFYHLLSKLSWVFWKEIFKEYTRTGRIARDLHAITTITYNSDCGQVTALAFNDLLFYSGFENGDVYLWKNIDGCQSRARVGGSVPCPVQAIYCNPEGTTTTKLQKGGSNNTESLLIVYKDLIRLQKDSKGDKWKLDIRRKPCENSHEFCPICPPGQTAAFEWYSGNQFHIVTNEKETRHVNSNPMEHLTACSHSCGMIVFGRSTGEIMVCEELDSLETLSDATDMKFKLLGRLGSSVRQVICKGKHIVCLTDDSNIYVSVNMSTFHKIATHDNFCCHVECIAWHGSVLAIGTKYGFVYVYHIPREAHLQNIDLKDCTTIQLNCEHVNNIAIGDDGSRVVVAVATDLLGVIHIIRW